MIAFFYYFMCVFSNKNSIIWFACSVFVVVCLFLSCLKNWWSVLLVYWFV